MLGNAPPIFMTPLTQQVSTLFGTQWAGGNEAKPGTVVVARWQQPNARSNADPATNAAQWISQFNSRFRPMAQREIVFARHVKQPAN